MNEFWGLYRHRNRCGAFTIGVGCGEVPFRNVVFGLIAVVFERIFIALLLPVKIVMRN
jgi:hypothetical protein